MHGQKRSGLDISRMELCPWWPARTTQLERCLSASASDRHSRSHSRLPFCRPCSAWSSGREDLTQETVPNGRPQKNKNAATDLPWLGLQVRGRILAHKGAWKKGLAGWIGPATCSGACPTWVSWRLLWQFDCLPELKKGKTEIRFGENPNAPHSSGPREVDPGAQRRGDGGLLTAHLLRFGRPTEMGWLRLHGKSVPQTCLLTRVVGDWFWSPRRTSSFLGSPFQSDL